MRTRLLAASALIAAPVAAGLAASPATAAGPELTISGDTSLAYILQDAEGPGNNTDGVDGDDIQHGDGGTQLIFNATATADNGLEYGAEIDWRTASDSIDEHYVFFGGSFGKVHFGSDDGVIDNMVVGGADALAGDALYDGEHQVIAANGLAEVTTGLDNDTGDANKISYYSPVFSGLSFGVSYVPNTDDGAITGGVTNGSNGSGAQVEGAAVYEGSFSGGGFTLGLGYAAGEGGDSLQDREGLEAGATVSFGDATIGAGYGDNFDTGIAPGATNDAGTFWNLGASYGFGPAVVYAGYAAATQDDAAGGEDDADYVGAGVEYTIAEGLLGFAEYGHSTAEDASANTEAETDYLAIGTIVSF